MAKSKRKHEKDIIEVIRKNKICRIQHIFGHYDELRSSQFYNLGLEKSESIKEELNKNCSKGANCLLDKWMASENATLQIAAMRLICTPEERRLLNQNYIDLTTNGNDLTPLTIEVVHTFGEEERHFRDKIPTEEPKNLSFNDFLMP